MRHPVRMTRYQLTGLKLLVKNVWRYLVYLVKELIRRV